MRHFAYLDTYAGTDRNGNTTRVTSLYRIVKNELVHVGVRKYQYESSAQSALNLALERKALPASYADKGGTMALEVAKLAKFREIS